MGWFFPHHTPTKNSVVLTILAEIAQDGNEVVERRIVGNHLWVAVRLGKGSSVGKVAIFLYLLKSQKEGWGYKDMDETMHPYYYDCPLSLLGIAKDFENDPGSAKWREGVRAFHAKKKTLAAITLLPGTEVDLSVGTCVLEGPYWKKGYWAIRRLSDGMGFKARIRYLRQVIEETASKQADGVPAPQEKLAA